MEEKMLVGNCRKEVIRKLQEVLNVLGGSSFAKKHDCSARSFILCSFLLLASLAPVHGQDPKANEARYEELPNFGRVNEKLYRGGQPRKGGVRRLAALGVNTIINLRDEDEGAVAEAKEAKAEGLRYFNVPFKRVGRPSDSQIDQVLSLIDAKENGVVFVHCHRGSDRTGTVIAVYRISHDKWTDTDAKREAERFGMKFWQRGMKDYISDYYRDRASRANQPKKKASRTQTVRPRGAVVGSTCNRGGTDRFRRTPLHPTYYSQVIVAYFRTELQREFTHYERLGV